MKWSSAVFSSWLVLAAPVSAIADTSSPVSIIDGDTLEVGGEIVRLYGIDAPELAQFCRNGSKRYRCGYEAALKLKKLIGSLAVDCQPTPVDMNDTGMICSVGLVDLSEAMLRNGLAEASGASLTMYRRAQHEAKQSKLGIWRGEFVPPAEWRAGRRLAVEDNQPVQICDIKGVVSGRGERVYFVTTDQEYGAIEIDETRGETMFCSDDQAELSGWRRWPKSAADPKERITPTKNE